MTPEHHTPLDTTETFRQRARYVVALVMGALVSVFVLWTTRQAVLLVFLGVAVGVLFYHASAWLAAKTRAPRGLMLGLVILGALGTLAVAVLIVGPRLAGEGQGLIESAPDILAAVRDRLGLPETSLTPPAAFETVSARLLGWFSTAAGVLSGLLVVLVVAAYTAADPDRYTAAVVRLFDQEHQRFVRTMLSRMGQTLLAWLRGVGIAVAALGTMAVVGLTLIGVPGALALAAFAAILTIIPTFGPFIGWAPAILVGFAEGTTTGTQTLVLALVAQQIEGSIITPKVQGEMVKVGPAFIVAGQIVLGALTGFLGILLVVPILGVGLILIQRLYIGPFVKGERAEPVPAQASPRAPPKATPTGG